MSLVLVPYSTTLVARSRGWADLEVGERKRRAVAAARDRDVEGLWGLTEANLATWGESGARVSVHTLRAYKVGVLQVIAAASGVSLLEPPLNWGASWVRSLEGAGLSASTVRARLAAARALWAGLRWAGASSANPFSDVRAPREGTAPWDKRSPYPVETVEKLLESASARNRVLILLGAHAGLRVSEACAVVPEDCDLMAGTLRVTKGKGTKVRVVSLSLRLCQALEKLEVGAGAPILGLGKQGARAALKRLCVRTGVKYQAVHALRHSSGTRMYSETRDLEAVARHLGHRSVETARAWQGSFRSRSESVISRRQRAKPKSTSIG